MIENDFDKMVLALSEALKMCDYSKFVSYFSKSAIFEIPFTVDGAVVFEGLPKIKEHFEHIGKYPLTRLIQIEHVNHQDLFLCSLQQLVQTNDIVGISCFQSFQIVKPVPDFYRKIRNYPALG